MLTCKVTWSIWNSSRRTAYLGPGSVAIEVLADQDMGGKAREPGSYLPHVEVVDLLDLGHRRHRHADLLCIQAAGNRFGGSTSTESRGIDQALATISSEIRIEMIGSAASHPVSMITTAATITPPNRQGRPARASAPP